MRIHPGCIWLGLPLLLTLEAARAAAEPATLPHSGEVFLALSPAMSSNLPGDPSNMAEGICQGRPGDQEAPGAVCSLKVWGSVTTPNGLLKAAMSGDPWNGFSLRARSLQLVGEPVDTSCGLWDVSVDLDAASPQPISALALEQASEDPTHGVFAGVLEMNAILHLVNRATGQTADFPLHLGFNLAGPWALLAETDGIDLPAGASDLILAADRDNGVLTSRIFCAPPTKDPTALDWFAKCHLCFVGVVDSERLGGPKPATSQ